MQERRLTGEEEGSLWMRVYTCRCSSCMPDMKALTSKVDWGIDRPRQLRTAESKDTGAAAAETSIVYLVSHEHLYASQ